VIGVPHHRCLKKVPKDCALFAVGIDTFSSHGRRPPQFFAFNDCGNSAREVHGF
jgi:hypothetical protein